MNRFLCPELTPHSSELELPEDESHHALRVLRLQTGAEIELLGGSGFSRYGSLEVRGKRAWVLISEKAGRTASSSEVVPLQIEAAVLRSENYSWVIEKCTELGVLAFQPVLGDHNVVKLPEAKIDETVEKWQRISDQSLKQCGRLHRMKILHPVPALKLSHPQGRSFSADETLAGTPTFWPPRVVLPSAETIHVSIGPEGGWSIHERALFSRNRETISLGPLVLRAETASIAIAASFALACRSASVS